MSSQKVSPPFSPEQLAELDEIQEIPAQDPITSSYALALTRRELHDKAKRCNSCGRWFTPQTCANHHIWKVRMACGTRFCLACALDIAAKQVRRFSHYIPQRSQVLLIEVFQDEPEDFESPADDTELVYMLESFADDVSKGLTKLASTDPTAGATRKIVWRQECHSLVAKIAWVGDIRSHEWYKQAWSDLHIRVLPQPAHEFIKVLETVFDPELPKDPDARASLELAFDRIDQISCMGTLRGPNFTNYRPPDTSAQVIPIPDREIKRVDQELITPSDVLCLARMSQEGESQDCDYEATMELKENGTLLVIRTTPLTNKVRPRCPTCKGPAVAHGKLMRVGDHSPPVWIAY